MLPSGLSERSVVGSFAETYRIGALKDFRSPRPRRDGIGGGKCFRFFIIPFRHTASRPLIFDHGGSLNLGLLRVQAVLYTAAGCPLIPPRAALEQTSRQVALAALDHSITSSARTSTLGGTSRPSALAVLRLIVSSYFVGFCTGSSPGFSPFRMRSTYDAAHLY